MVINAQQDARTGHKSDLGLNFRHFSNRTLTLLITGCILLVLALRKYEC